MSKFEKPTLMIDVQEFQQYLDDPDATDEEKQQLLETLWCIICEFAFFGFGVTSIQQMQEICGKEGLSSLEVIQGDSSAVESEEETIVQQFVAACDKEQEGGKTDA